jgi:hypothetical protein
VGSVRFLVEPASESYLSGYAIEVPIRFVEPEDNMMDCLMGQKSNDVVFIYTTVKTDARLIPVQALVRKMRREPSVTITHTRESWSWLLAP